MTKILCPSGLWVSEDECESCGQCRPNESEQLSFLTEKAQKSLGKDLLIRRWENGFQKWSDRNALDGYTSLGACGYGSMCDYCKDNSYGRPCVRALNAMLRETGKTIDYKTMSFEDVWEGVRA